MERSRYLLLAVALMGVMASPTAEASPTPRSRPQAAAPVQHKAPNHAVQHRVAPPSVRHTSRDHRHTLPRMSVVTRYVPVIRVASGYPVTVPPHLVAVPAPYYVAAGAQPVQEIATAPSAGFPPDWNWRPVESFAALAPRADSTTAPAQQQVRYYCPDTREYFPAVETCDSSWLKVIP